jgi:hypothetical protein
MYPRSLREAFPEEYTNPIESPREKISPQDFFTSLLAIIVWGWLILFFVKE